MRKLILLAIFISLSIYLIKTNFVELKYHLPLPIKIETRANLTETKKMLQGNPMKIARWLDNNITGKSDGRIQYAQTPEETFERRTGDCEDYSILAKYFLDSRYDEIYLIIWQGKSKSSSEHYAKRKQQSICHCICVFKIGEKMWGIMDNSNFIMAYGSIEDIVKADCEFRDTRIGRAYIVRFTHYIYRRIKKLDIK